MSFVFFPAKSSSSTAVFKESSVFFLDKDQNGLRDPKETISVLFSVNLFGTRSCTALLCFARKELLLKLGSTRQKLDEQLLRT